MALLQPVPQTKLGSQGLEVSRYDPKKRQNTLMGQVITQTKFE
jgi:hypothetical protein